MNAPRRAAAPGVDTEGGGNDRADRLIYDNPTNTIDRNAVALQLHEAGWHPVPLPLGKKYPPESGTTGYDGRDLTAGEVATRDWSDCSIGARMSPDVVGIDVDAYNGGDVTFAATIDHLGALPPTVMTTARSDGSGIRMFRVPVGTAFESPGTGIDIIQWFHRYAVVAPSTNPKVANAAYRWIDEQSGESLDNPPQVDDLPELPWAWIEALAVVSKGRKADTAATPAEVRGFFDTHVDEFRPAALNGVRTKLGEPLMKGRHDTLIAFACWMMREAAAGFYSAAAAVEVLGEWWNEVMDDPRRRESPEFGSCVVWAVAEALADPEQVAELRESITPQDQERSVPSTTKPEVIVSSRHLDEIADELVEILVAQNDPLVMFNASDAVSVLEDGSLTPLDQEALHDELERRVRPIAVDKKGKPYPGRFSSDLRKLVLRRIKGKLPKLESLATAPFMRADGSICLTPGYDKATTMYLLDRVDVNVPDKPTPDDLAAAVAMIDEVLHDFPLQALCDRAHAFSLALTPAMRHLVPLAPMHALDGNAAGVGKNLLAETVLGIHQGFGHEDRLPIDAIPTDEEEMRKQVTSILAEGRRVVLWDEAHCLIGKQLAKLLTSVKWSDRYLGTNVTIKARNSLTTVSLGNQIEIVGDLRRRVVKISLATDLVAPSLRSDFRHPELHEWAAAHRGELLGAVLTLLRAWHVAGRPEGDVKLGSFEAWASMIGGTLKVAGVDGFLDNVNDVLEDGDSLDADFAAHLGDLIEEYGKNEFTTREVVAKASMGISVDHPIELPSDIDPHGPRATEMLGKLYRRFKGKPLPPYGARLEKTGLTGAKSRWRVAQPPARGAEGGIGRDRSPSVDLATSGLTTPPPSTKEEKHLVCRHDYRYPSLPIPTSEADREALPPAEADNSRDTHGTAGSPFARKPDPAAVPSKDDPDP